MVIGIVLSAGAMFFAFRNVPFAELTAYMSSINYVWVIPSVMLSMISFVFRAFRWQTILNSSHAINFEGAFHPLMIAFMLNTILPGRLGEVSRPIILTRRNHIAFSTGLATVAVERIFDVCMLLILFAGTLTMVQIDPQFQMTFGNYVLNRSTLISIGKGMILLCLILLTVIILLNFNRIQMLIKNMIFLLPNLIPMIQATTKDQLTQKVCLSMIRIVDNIVSGLSLIKHPKKIYICILYSMVIWGLQAGSFYTMSIGCPGINLSFAEITAIMVIICFFIALPSVPGYWGLWEAGGIFAMSLFGVAATDAAGYTLTNHAVQFFPVIIVGIISLLMIGMNIGQVASTRGISHADS